MPRDEDNDSPGAQRTITDLWSMNMNPMRHAVAQLRTPTERAEASFGAPQTEPTLNAHGAAPGAPGAHAQQRGDVRVRGRGGVSGAVPRGGGRGAGAARGRRGGAGGGAGRGAGGGRGRAAAPLAPGHEGSTAGRKRKIAPAVEEDIDNTDHEVESEDEETAEDRQFIDNSSQDEEQGLHAACDRLDEEPWQGRAPRASDEAEPWSDKKRTRSERRALLPLLERGMAEADRKVCEYYHKAPYGLPTPNRLVTPYWLQQGHERQNNQLVSGAFGSDQQRAWCNDRGGHVEFAARFFAPWKEDIALRVVSTDLADTVVNPLVCSSNSTAKILHAIKTTHKQTELDLINGKFIQNVFVGLQHTSRELALAMHSGPFGGIQGKADVVLWNIRHGDEVSNTSEDILNLVELISEGLQGTQGDELWPSVCTLYTEPFVRGKRGMQRVQNGAQTVREYNHHKAASRSVTHTVDDIDPQLSRRLWEYRMPGVAFPQHDKRQLSRLVDSRYQSNDPSVAGDPVVNAPQPPVTEPVLADVFLWKHVVRGVDELTRRITFVSVDAVYIIAKFPANDPLVMLQRMAENRTKLCTLLTNTMNHMNLVLGKPSCAFDQLFNTDRAGAADLVCEARMVEGFFRYCDTQRIRNVNLGGLRIDVANYAEMQLWKRYVDNVVDARRTHFQMLTDLALQDRANGRESRLPVESWALDYYPGVNFRKVARAQLLEEMAAIEASWVANEDAANAKASLLDWLNAQILDASGEFVLLCEGEAFARNCGVWFKIKTDSKRSEEEERVEQLSKRNAKAEESLLGTMSQPQQDVSMVRLLLTNLCSEHDPLDEFLASAMWIPDVDWLTREMHRIKQVDAVQWLRDAIGQYQLVMNIKRLHQTDTRRAELFRLVGKEKHPLRATLAQIGENTNIDILFRARVLKINSAVNQSLQVMRSCELLQFRIAAMSVEDLKKQGVVANAWVKDFEPQAVLEKQLLAGEAYLDMLSGELLLAHFWALSTARIDVDLSYMNHLLMTLDRACMMTHCMNTPGAYGQTLRVMDMAGTVNVLREPEKNNLKQTELYMYDPKYAGAGLDQTKGNKGQQENAHLNFNTQTPALQREAVNNCDHSMRNVSKLSYTTLMGSGVLMNGEGVILAHQRAHQTELGLCCYWSEFGKEGAEAHTMGWIESTMAHSGNADTGTEAGVKEASWNTTVQMENQSVCPLRKLPVTILTGNRPCNATPASAVEGGRWITIASSTQDKDNGLFVCRGACGGHDTDVQAQLAQHAQVLLANDMSTGDVRSDIRIIDRVTAQNNMLYFLLLQWLRKDATLLCSSLTVDPRPYNYSLRSNYRNLECAVGRLASGLRRPYLANANVWHRNAVGPWSRVLLVATHVSNVMGVALLGAMRRMCAGAPFDLALPYFLGIRALLTQPIGFLATLASLHLWLSAAVLDINVMIVTCYVFHFSGFQHTCTLRVLSLVLAGHADSLSEDDLDAYLRLCDFLAPCVLEHDPGLAAGLRPPPGGPRPVLQGVLDPPSKEVLEKWAYWNVPAAEQDIRQHHVSRTHGARAELRSTYCQPNLGFVHSEYIKGFGSPPSGGYHTQPDKNICGSPQRTLATMFALQQKEEAHRRRVTQSVPMLEHENTPRFWAGVRAGTALPTPNMNTNDVFKLRFPFVAHTGVWWDEAMGTAGSCDGVLKQFVLQSALSPAVTQHEFFTRLLAPYLRRRGMHARVYGGPDALGAQRDAWATPVIDSRQNMFEFCCNPSVSVQGKTQGIEVNICMRLVHFVVLQGLGVTRDWSPAAHDNASFVSCVHLRNMSHVSLGCLSLLLHTCIDKALVPVNSGLVQLPVPSPVLHAKAAAAIEYDARLHVDTHTAAGDGRSENMLSVSARSPSVLNWTILSLAHGEHFLLYRSVADAWPEMKNARARHELFPFPPESVAHAAHIIGQIQACARRWALERAAPAAAPPAAPPAEAPRAERADPACALRYHNNLLPAMLALGRSIGPDEVAHEQHMLTLCSVQDGRELACMSWEHGLLFTARVERQRVVLRPTLPTHEWPAVEAMAHSDIMPFSAMPFPDETSVCVSEFQELLKHGVCLEGRSVEVDMRHPKRAGLRSLPCVMCPVVHWPVLLLLAQDGWTLPERPGLHVRPSADLFREHAERFVVLEWRAETPRGLVEPHVAALAAAERLEPAVFWAALDACLALDAALRVVCSPASPVSPADHAAPAALQCVWLECAGELQYFASVAELCHAALAPETDGSRPVALVAALEDRSCGVRRLPSGRHVACFWDFHVPAVLQERCQEAARALAACEARAPGASATVTQREVFESDLEALREGRDESAARRAAAGPAGARAYVSQAFFELAALRPVFAPAGDALLRAPRRAAGSAPLPPACWGLVLERDGAFLRDGRYCVSARADACAPPGAAAPPPEGTAPSIAFDMDFATMSRAMLQEGTELWVHVNNTVYALILQHARLQGTRVMLPVSEDMHARLLDCPRVSRALRVFYVLGGSSHIKPIEANTVRLILIVAGKGSTPGRKSTADDRADAASRVNESIGPGHMKMITVTLPLYAQDGTPLVTYHRDPALPFYYYIKEDNISRARGSTAL